MQYPRSHTHLPRILQPTRGRLSPLQTAGDVHRNGNGPRLIEAAEALRKYRDFFLSEEVTVRMPSGTEMHLGV